MFKYEIQKATRLHTAKYHILALPICMVMYLVYHMSYNNDTFYNCGTTFNAKVATTLITSEMADKDLNPILFPSISHLNQNIHNGLITNVCGLSLAIHSNRDLKVMLTY